MARIRTIKPEFWTDERLTGCSLGARLLFIGMLNFSDDNGNQAYSAKRLKMQIFPADAIDAQPLLDELLAQGVVIEYSVSGEKFLHIKGFRTHQVINRPSSTRIPQPAFIVGSVSPQEELTDGREGKGEDREIPSLSSAAPTTPAEHGKPKKSDPQALPACPHSDLIDLFGQRLPELPQPVKSLWADGKNGAATKSRWSWVLTACHEKGERKGQRLAQTTEEAMDWFDRYFRYVAKSDFLTGREGEWTADMGWLMAKGNFEKVISGNYENKLESA